MKDVIKQRGITFDSISSDGIRGALLKDYMAKNNCSRDVAFDKTMKSGPAEYSRQLRDIVRSCGD